MRRGNFRAKNRVVTAPSQPREIQALQAPAVELEALQEQINGIGDKLLPLKAALETLVAQQRHDNDTVPADLGKAVRSVLERLDRLERNQAKTGAQFSKMETTFSNALLKMGDKVEKIAGGEDSKFSLAHSLEQLIDVLKSRSYSVVRDNDGNMAALETRSGKKAP